MAWVRATIALGISVTLVFVACRDGESGAGDDGGPQCTTSCAEAIVSGGVPCDFDQPGADAYRAYLNCAAANCGMEGECEAVIAGHVRANELCTMCMQDKCPDQQATCMDR